MAIVVLGLRELATPDDHSPLRVVRIQGKARDGFTSSTRNTTEFDRAALETSSDVDRKHVTLSVFCQLGHRLRRLASVSSCEVDIPWLR